MAMQLNKALIFLVLVLLFSRTAIAVELLPPADLIAKYQLTSESIQVVEPHESTPGKPKFVRYKAIPIDVLLTGLFGQSWRSNDSRILFLAKDGYRTVVSKAKLDKFRAYLAFERNDGKAFVVDNIAQGEKKVNLAPYYLVWDNKDSPELLRQSSYGWPYQVARIELQTAVDNLVLHPGNGKGFSQEIQETEDYCLTCHAINGVGGQKYPTDLVQAACQMDEQTLKKWIDKPDSIKPGTTMPALTMTLPKQERQATIGRIVAYLNAMRNEPDFSCKAQ